MFLAILKAMSSNRTLEKATSSVVATPENKKASLQALVGSATSIRRKRLPQKLKITLENINIEVGENGVLEPKPVDKLLNWEIQRLSKAAYNAKQQKVSNK